MAVQVLAGPVVPHRRSGVGVSGSDLHVAQVSVSVEHGREIGVAEYMRMCPRDLDAGGFGEVRRRRVAACRSIRAPRVFSRIGPRSRRPAARSMARPTAGGSGTRTTLVPLPHTRSTRWPCSSPRSAMSALWPRRSAGRAGRAWPPARNRMGSPTAGGGEQGLELQVREPQGRRLGGHRRAAHMLSGRMRQDAIENAGPVEPGRHREPPGHG